MARMLNIIPESADVYCDGWFMVFDATFNNISVILWRSVLFIYKGIRGRDHIVVVGFTTTCAIGAYHH
jgi:hypothetical protein